jgi:hypothetical protein
VLRTQTRVLPPLAAIVFLFAGCGGGTTPTAPSPAPSPAPAPAPAAPSGFSGAVVDTISGAPVAGFSASLNGGRLIVSAPGYVTRDTRPGVTRVDLIPAAGFDLEFYREFARGSLEGSLQPLRVLRESPSFYMEVEGAKGLSAQTAVQLQSVARRMIPELTGGRLRVVRWETGPTPRAPQPGWIMIERQDQQDRICGRALVGASAGQIFLDGNRLCRVDAVFAHELGHAVGFWHVNQEGSLMFPQQRDSNVADAPTERERRHAAIAYARSAGNRDVDVDP